MSENEILEPEFENEDVVNDNQNTIHSESKKKPYHTESFLYTFMVAFGVIFLFCQLMFQIILTPIKVVGSSMQPTINMSILSDDDEDHCDIVYYRQNKTYQNGDVVIISNKSQDYIKDNEVGFLIKRIIALPGQSITFFLTNVAEKDGETAYFDNLEVLKETAFLEEIKELEAIVASASSTSEEKIQALEVKNEKIKMNEKEKELAKLIKEKGYENVYVEYEGNKINVLVAKQDASKTDALDIIRSIYPSISSGYTPSIMFKS